MILDSTLRKLQVVLTTAQTTSPMPILVDWVDNTSTTFTPGLTPSNTNGISVVDILAAPAASTQRKVNSISISNKDTASKVVQVILNDNATSYQITSITLAVNETLGYTDTQGWYVLDTSGARKGVGPTGSTGSQGIQGIPSQQGWDGLDGEDGLLLIGPQGLQGIAGTPGVQGPIGPAIFLVSDGEDGDMGFPGTGGGVGGGGATGGGVDHVFYNNDITVTTNYTIPTNQNSGSFGPIIINSGVTVTVPTGSVWSII